MYKKSTIEESISLVQEWKASGLSQYKFAALIGMTRDQLAYQIRKVRELSPDSLDESSEKKIEFAPVPQDSLSCGNQMYDAGEMADQPSLMFQSAAGCLQVTNQIDPYLLKVAMEVMLSC